MSASPVRFAKLPAAEQVRLARRMSAMMSAGGSYHAVEGDTSKQRSPALVELGGEDEVLLPMARHKITNLARQEMRNSTTARTIDQQRRVNVVGLLGGKLTLTFPSEYAAAADAYQNFWNNEWAPQAEFTDGMHFNEVLKLCLSSGDNAGDLTLLFDDGLLADTGRIRAFESDEHANLAPAAFATRFANQGLKQSQGRIYDALGRAVGVVVSSGQRGRIEFEDGKCFVLTADPMADRRDNFWTIIRRTWRFNQGRGVSPLASALTTLIDLHNITANETQSANLNAKLLGQIIDSSEEKEADVPSEFGPGDPVPTLSADGSPLSDAEQAEIAAAIAADAEPPPLSCEQFKAIGAMFDLMPPKLKMELMDTKRPNPNMQAFIDWLSGNVTGVYGLGRVYANLNPEASYTAFRGAQCLSWPSIEEAQKDLERSVCDWACRNVFKWAQRTRRVTLALPPGWQNMLSWSWPRMREVNEVDAETAMEKKLTNRTTNYRETLGPNWRQRLDQSFEEEDYFKSRGHIHPAQKTVSGAVVADEKKPADNNRGKDTEK